MKHDDCAISRYINRHSAQRIFSVFCKREKAPACHLYIFLCSYIKHVLLTTKNIDEYYTFPCVIFYVMKTEEVRETKHVNLRQILK